ncbi:MAG TPA: hypothetical protein VFV95_17520 [Vicinamibacterales bacterium]|nr:hypothetical protein [Vicinamibacterales bacterium]
MARRPAGFVSLTSLKTGPPDPQSALDTIRRIYFATTKETIVHDLAHAIELLKSLPDEATREKASVYMEGLNEMRRDWGGRQKRGAARKPRSR